MFKSHPIFGVGLDRYGAYFREYRDATQSLRRGPDLVSNAAHNIPIQIAATGGIVLLIGYLLFTFFVLWRAIVALKKLKGKEQLTAAALIGAWAAYELQSMISIDNLGISVWGYLLAGAIVGISIMPDEPGAKQVPISLWPTNCLWHFCRRLASRLCALLSERE
jgi:O-antigen ligase